MNWYMITFRSVTFAQRGERLLAGRGLRCALQRAPAWMEEQGCGYAVKLHTRDIAGAVAALRQEQIPLRRVYAQGPEGKLEPLAL